MNIAILIYDGFTALDAIGPYEVLAQVPGSEVHFVAETARVVKADTGYVGLEATKSILDLETADILVVPGGPGDELVRQNERMLGWIRKIHEDCKWTTSVCSGSLILGAAGLLKGKRATSHWFVIDRLREFGAEPTHQRIVEDGKLITAAGVSAGIDMGLRLAQRIGGNDLAQMIQLGIEYDPEPPFDAGSPSKAPEHVVESVRRVFDQLNQRRLESFKSRG